MYENSDNELVLLAPSEKKQSRIRKREQLHDRTRMPSLRLLHSSLVEMKHSSNFATDPEQSALQLKLVA